jgi:hypothetical protein
VVGYPLEYLENCSLLLGLLIVVIVCFDVSLLSGFVALCVVVLPFGLWVMYGLLQISENG